MDLFQELQNLVNSLRRDAVPYALCGGLALAVHGFVRATEDIDLLVEEVALPKLRASVEPLGFRFDPHPMAFQNGGVILYRLLKTAGEDFVLLDLLLVTPMTQSAWDSRRVVETEFGPVSVVSPAGLIHLKSLRRSGQDEVDIRQLNSLNDESAPT
ncbi:MAG: hypothetical protein EXS36_13670 [Pedosphaera sp.]|nr:hypothetical protein [Pedosphaera sp.]